MKPMPPFESASRLEELSALDPVIDQVRSLAREALSSQELRDLLHGVWKGTPLHPALTDVTIGAFLSAALLDVLPGNRTAATMLVLTGIASAVPTAASGLADWLDLEPDQARVGFVHATLNTAALVLYAASLGNRVRGRHFTGRLLGFAGLAVASASAQLGGHLSFRQSAGVSRADTDARDFPGGWQDVAALDDVPEGLSKQEAAGTALCVYRRGTDVRVLIDRCAHLSGPLSEGEVIHADGSDCVVCPWHGSTFRLDDGAPVHGPATAPAPALRNRVSAGRLEVLLKD